MTIKIALKWSHDIKITNHQGIKQESNTNHVCHRKDVGGKGSLQRHVSDMNDNNVKCERNYLSYTRLVNDF